MGDPADGTKVSMLAFEQAVKALEWDNRGDFFRFELFLNGDFKEPKRTKKFSEPLANITLAPEDFLLDNHNFGWTFTPVKLAVGPFIPDDEFGETHIPFHFRLDRDLIPSPLLNSFSCVLYNTPVNLSWNGVDGAKRYAYTLKNLSNNTVVASGETEGLQAGPFAEAVAPFPASYEWSVAAGIQDMNGVWVFGPPAKSVYRVAPAAPTELLPNGAQLVELGPDASVNFSWKGITGVSAYHFSLFKVDGNGDLHKVVENKTVNGVSILMNNLDFASKYYFTVTAKVEDIICSATNGVHFETKVKPFEAELGFNFTIVDCDKFGFCLPDIKYNLTVTAPNNSTVFARNGLLSNTAGITYAPNSSGVNNGELPIMSGVYTLTVILVQIGPEVAAQPSKPAWLFSAKSMDIFPLLNNLGAAIELDAAAQGGQVNPVQNAIIKIQFKYDAANNNIQ